MANALATIILRLTLLCRSATGARTKASALGSQQPPSSLDALADDNGICQSMVDPQNYDCEEHTLAENYGPAILQHGVFMDGIMWLLLPADKLLAFLLADNNFDVCRGHTSLSPDDPAYWDWTWDNLVSSDLPAVFNYVYDQTAQKLHYVGHSQGTLMALAAFSREQFLVMLRAAVLHSPIAYIGQMTSPIARSAVENFLAEALYQLGVYEFDPRGDAVVKLLQDICQKTGVDCTYLLTSFTGPKCCLNSTIVNVFLDHEPQPTSTENLIHLAQMVRDGKISMYDYGNEGQNIEHYGQATPPLYNMSSIPNNLPFFLSYGRADALSDMRDVKLLLDSLKDHDGDKLVTQYRVDYAHADFVMGENAREVVLILR
ncbi:hypothetical protein EUGRSUZ_A01090 [Eucalyptus grandis]|uniref:Lipase n=2 Tax=Eucalyptus grandis TaxID=71139 RepID=A0A059DER2_EUCGR|nr:hypothetical protein EUGRSUZ_A01090 [Eucalyptus grandis]